MAKLRLVTLAGVFTLASAAPAAVFINEVYINPPGTSDDGREFIELLGTPGMKLDGYAIAALNGTEEKLYPLGSIPPIPIPYPEIDELFSLDGLTLGANGILVLGIQIGSEFWFPTLLSDSNFAQWTTLWNGGLDVPGQLENNGSLTLMLVRNRPGRTEADPTNPLGLRWGKDIPPDAELITPVLDPQDGQWKDQWGDGNLDKGQANGLGGNTLDMKGASTLGDITDDLEVVDEVSYEDGRGWEYDLDGRRVDLGSSSGGLQERRIHTLNDPAGFNPDALSRVDYRTKGDGWTPVAGGTGEMSNGNNWPDTATEQWIRGEGAVGTGGQGSVPQLFYVNDPNADPDAVQPYQTHVPTWLDPDAPGAVPPLYDFSTANTYQIMAGRINPLAVPFIPGDCDRDGECDLEDIAKLSAVYGDDDWTFSNSFTEAPEGDSGDPATQTRPWDVDATGDNGIEASDLQWTLNFQGDTAGQIVGIQYDSTTPAATGVYLNPNAGLECTLTTSVNIPGGCTLSTLLVGDLVEVTVLGQVTAGANTTAGQENGIMQYVHDLAINSPGVIKVTAIQPLGSFDTVRSALQVLQGTNGDLGVELINGFTTAFTEGLAGPASLYRLTLQAVGEGSADLTLTPAAAAKFAAGTPHGLKVGHTDSDGNPSSSVYPAPLSVTVIAGVPGGDADGDNTPDGCDGCPNDPDKIEPGLCGCGVVDDPTDSDGDAVPDCVDICPGFDDNQDADGDGVPDGCDVCPGFDDNADADGDNTPDGCDGCPNDPDKIDPGVCGCGVPDDDTDGDTVEDCIDNCPLDYNTAQRDTDMDGVGNRCDNCKYDYNPGQEDADGDEVGDACDGCPNDPDKTEPGICGCGTPDTDSDGDLTPDCNDACPYEPALTTPSEPGTELTCDDGIDNDCDGLTDTQDSQDCAAPGCICGDIDGSGGSVNLDDFATFAICYGMTGPGGDCDSADFDCSDIDGSGLVNLEDFATFALYYGLITTNTVPDCPQP